MITVARPATPTASNRRNSRLLVQWYDYACDLERRIKDLESGAAPSYDPPPAPALGEPLILKAGVVYFNDGVSPAGYSGGVQVLSAPGSANPHWRQTTAAGSWDWIVPAGQPFTAGIWTAVGANSSPSPSPDPAPGGSGRSVPFPRLYGGHEVVGYLGGKAGSESAPQTIARALALKYRVHWIHTDRHPDTNGNIRDAFEAMYAAAKGTDASILPGMHGNGFSQAQMDQFVRDFCARPATLRLNGKPCVAIYDYRDFNEAMLEKIAADVNYLAFAEPDVSTCPSLGPDSYGDWPELANFFAANPKLAGFINFAVGGAIPHDDPRKVQWTIDRNNRVADVCRRLGRISVGGFAIKYQGRRMADTGIIAVQDAHLKNPCDLWLGETWNDNNPGPAGDDSAFGDIGTDFDADGVSVWIPQRNAGYGTPRKVDREIAVRRLLQPKIDAYLALP